MILFVSIFSGLSVFLILFVLIRKFKSTENFQTKVRLQQLTAVTGGRFSEPRKTSAIMTTRDWSTLTFSERIIAPISDSIQRFFMKLAPRTIFKTIERHIILAGKQNVWDVNKAVLVWGLTIFAFFAVGLVIFFATKMLLIQRVTILLVLTAIGVMVPISCVKSIIRERQEKIVTELPPFLDLLSVSVQAGLSFDAAVDRILKHSTGALMDEFRQMQKDLRLGLSKKEALHEMAGRCDIEEVYLFTTSIIQAERLGTSMSKTLVEQSANMRERYQQKIKSKALKAPIKILFPLVLLIFPTIFIIILLPPIISVLNNLNILPK